MNDKPADAIVAQVRPVAAKIAHLSIEGRITLLSALLAQEICNLPLGERADELERILESMPGIVRATERGMRQALTENARNGI